MSNKNENANAEELYKIIESLGYLNNSITFNVVSSGESVFQDNRYSNVAEVEAEVNWSKNHQHTAIYHEFCGQMGFITFSEAGLIGGNDVHLKMCFSYAVTLMESCLCEMLKSVTMRYDQFKRNAMSNFNELSSEKIKVSELFDKDPKDVINSKIIEQLSHILYHDLRKVKRVYNDILGKDISTIENDAYKKASELMKMRHDIVHRNGKKMTGESIDITRDTVDSCIRNITLFVKGVHNYINDAIAELNTKKTD